MKRILTVITGLVLLAGNRPANAQGLVFTRSTFRVGNNPVSVAAADVNGDGAADLISANLFMSSSLTVLTNNGAGAFGSNVTIQVGGNPMFVLTEDFNGDGKMDFVCANSGSYPNTNATLMVFTNDGGGHFGLACSQVVGNGSVTTADVNGDGKVDLINANYYNDSLTVLTNNGRGVISSNATYNVGFSPAYVVAADVNRDGKVDLISALMVLTNNGEGVFGFNATISSPEQVNSLVAMDVNGDGSVDLVGANLWRTLTIFTNNGSGVFNFNATLSIGNGAMGLVVVDMNGDGKLDVVTANSSDSTLTVLTNGGNGFLGFNATLNTGLGPNALVAADVNGDGRMDLITPNAGTNTLTVLTQMIPVPPLLNIRQKSFNSFDISWSSLYTDFVLQTNGSLTTVNWSDVECPIATSNGTNQSASITSVPPGNLFFRLRR